MKYIIAVLILSISMPVFAQDTGTGNNLVLYPKGREAYAQKFRDKSEQYEVEGRNYIDDLYSNSGEGSVNTSSSEPMLPEATLDAVLDNTPTTSAPAAPPEMTTTP